MAKTTTAQDDEGTGFSHPCDSQEEHAGPEAHAGQEERAG